MQTQPVMPVVCSSSQNIPFRHAGQVGRTFPPRLGFTREAALELDIADDVFEMGATQHHCFGTLKKKMAIWILGGGVP